jgi:hypothetical protein
MTEDREAHLSELLHEFAARFDGKYRKGAEQHGGKLFDYSKVDLVDEALNETLDLWAYLATLRHKYGKNAVNARFPIQLINAVASEMASAECEHGKLTDDNFRACTILTEEVGEVARAVLEIRRHKGTVQQGAPIMTQLRGAAITELIQVISTCVLMIENLDDERKYHDGRADSDTDHPGSAVGQRGERSSGACTMP